MAGYKATVFWERDNQVFIDNKYSRAHKWIFDGGIEVDASSSPSVIPPPLSNPAAVDPEEAFIASISSCHMLWFLAFAGKERFRVDSYTDEAIGEMGKNLEGRIYVESVTLRPRVKFSGDKKPSEEEYLRLHEKAHEHCFIANSVITNVQLEPKLITQE